MPANKNAMTRYALIDNMLANRNRSYSIQDITDTLAERLPEYGQQPVSKRCVEKDLNYLQFDSPFDVEIEEYWIEAADKNDRPYRKRCIRYADPTFSIFKPKLTEDEKGVLSTALDTLGSFDGLENFNWLSDLKSRLHLEEHEPVISISKNLLTNSTLLARLFTAIRNKQVIKLSHHTYSSTDIREVNVSPHLLKEYNNRWFLIAAASDTGRTLTFPLDRVDDFKENQLLQYIPMGTNLTERFEEIIGVTFDNEAPLEDIVFWVSDKSKDYVSTKPIHESQTAFHGQNEATLQAKFPALINGAFFKIQCRKNYELVRELASFGPDLLVLSPSHISEAIQERIEQMIESYRNIHPSNISDNPDF